MAQLDLDEVLLALRAILLSVGGLPADRVWDDTYVAVGTQKVAYQPKPNVSYLTEQLAPGSSELQTNTSRDVETNRPQGEMLDAGLYLPTWFGITGEGGKAIRAGTTAIKNAFYPSRVVVLGSGNRLRINGKPAPFAGQIIQLEGGHSYQQVTIPYLVEWNLL